MDLIPITKLKISKEKWLNTKIQYEDNYKIQNVLEIMSRKTYSWIKSKNDIEILMDYDSFQSEFINLMYNKYVR